MTDRRGWLLEALNLAWRHGHRYARNKATGPLGRGDMLAILAEHEAEHGRDDRPALHLALRNVRTLAKRLRRTDPENAAHLLRFCDDAGVRDSILRAEEPSE